MEGSKMDIAIVTGASKGIGLAICKVLVDLGYKVIGLSRDYSHTEFKHEQFIQRVCDITQTDDLISMTKSIIKEYGEVRVLVNNAGLGYFGGHETIVPEKLEQMVNTNLLAPMILTQQLLESIKSIQGFIINIASTAALHPGRMGCGYSATKAGLHAFSEALFDEVRKSGVKVVTIYPDMTKTNFYDQVHFQPADDENCYIEPDCVADALRQILNQKDGVVVSQIVIRPQRLQIDYKKL